MSIALTNPQLLAPEERNVLMPILMSKTYSQLYPHLFFTPDANQGLIRTRIFA
jgi:hypothetical protein